MVRERGNEGAIRWTVLKLGLAIFFTMNLMAFTIVMWSVDVYDVDADPLQRTLFDVFRWLSLLLAWPVMLLIGLPLFQSSWRAWIRGHYSTDLLIVAAVAAAYALSTINVVRGQGRTYFEVGAAVLVMVTLGRWIEATGKQKATETLDQLWKLLPDSVQRLTAGGAEISTPLDSIQPGDHLRLRAGERIPTDGAITSGTTTVDEQIFSGESRPLFRATGDRVLAGTLNLDGDLRIKVTACAREGSFGRLLQTLETARRSRGRYQRLADRVTSWFFPLVTAVAVLSFVWHRATGAGSALQTALSVLLIACPCALGLATPLAIWTALSTAAGRRVVLRSGDVIERLADASFVCIDKTGTLTTGEPRVAETVVFEVADRDKALAMAATLAGSSAHPFSRAVTASLQQDRTADQSDCSSGITDIVTVPGAGVKGTSGDGRRIRLGSPAFATEIVQQTASTSDPPDGPGPHRSFLERVTQQSGSACILSVDGRPVAGFLIQETPRPEASGAIADLQNLVREVHVLSGDRPEQAAFLRRSLQADRVNGRNLHLHFGLSPQDKVDRVTRLSCAGRQVVMVGDGINDAPALAASDVGNRAGLRCRRVAGFCSGVPAQRRPDRTAMDHSPRSTHGAGYPRQSGMVSCIQLCRRGDRCRRAVESGRGCRPHDLQQSVRHFQFAAPADRPGG